MDNPRMETDSTKYKKQISKISQGELIDLQGASVDKSVIQTMNKVSVNTEKETIINFELFSGLSEGVFEKTFESKIPGPIRMKIGVIGMGNIHQEEKYQECSLQMMK